MNVIIIKNVEYSFDINKLDLINRIYDGKNIRGIDTIEFNCERCCEKVLRTISLFTKCLCKTCLTKETMLRKYGVESALQLKEFKEKAIKTNIEKYGIENAFKSEKIKEKIRSTLIKNFDTDHPMRSEKIKKKIKNTMLLRYGVENAFQIKEVRKKTEQNNLIKYGSKSNLHGTNEKKIQEIKLKKYGTLNFINSKKTVDYYQKQYGVSHFKKSEISKKKDLLKLYNKITSGLRTNNLVTALFSSEELIGTSRSNHYNWKCRVCDTEFRDHLYSGHIPRCPICFPKLNGSSKAEKEIVEYLLDKNLKIKENNRKIIYPQELDIYIPSKKLAIEFNGTYWHSTERKIDRWYHQIKVEKCDRLNIRLLHIYEWEWINNQQECIDKINYYLTHDDRIKSRKPIARFVMNKKEIDSFKENCTIVFD